MLGSGGVIIMDDHTCMVKAALRIMRFYAMKAAAGAFRAAKAQPG